MDRLARLQLSGFKSIRSADIVFNALNVLIGPNGAGKSNLISFFKLLNWMTPTPGDLQFFIGKAGGAHALLHDGPAVTPQISATLTFEHDDQRANEYAMRLEYAAPDTLIFADERYRFTPPGKQHDWVPLGAGHREMRLIDEAEQGKASAKFILGLLKRCVVYQFHNTSETARIRQRWDINDMLFLKEDAANIAPFLLRLREQQPRAYLRIVETIRLLAPFFGDFVLEPANGTVLLQWNERHSDMVFGAHQASDGMLRAIALVTLLLQPTEQLPSVIILDEPELGLHPFAINIITGLLKSVSLHRQVILATQSMTLVDYFAPEDILVVERPARDTHFHRLDPTTLQEWLAEYSLAELWEKNVLGGRPG